MSDTNNLPANVTLIQVPMYRSAIGMRHNTAKEAAETNLYYQIMKLVEDIGDKERDGDEKYLANDDVVELIVSNGSRIVRILQGEAVYPWPKGNK